MPTDQTIQDQTPVSPKPNTGIVNNVTAPDPLASLNTKPITTEVNVDNETVESRLNKLTASGSKYVEQARGDAQRAGNKRGMINSAMSAGAGEEAAIKSALPIAQQDAKTFTDTRTLNQNTQNDFLKNRQSADLNMETAGNQNELDMVRDTNSEKLNEKLASFNTTIKQTEMKLDAELKIKIDQRLNDAKFSDEVKLRYVTTIDGIIKSSDSQIVEIGLSDRSAEQQATAISLVNQRRDAELEVYENLLDSFPDWHWGTDFTPKVDNSLAVEAAIKAGVDTKLKERDDSWSDRYYSSFDD